MHRSFGLLATALVMTAALLTGCAAPPYRVPGTETQPLSSLAVVKSGPRGASYFVSIDGERVPHVLRPVDRWELSPGEHTAVVGLRTHPQFYADRIYLKFVVLPGKNYVIPYEVNTRWGRGTWRGWIEDEGGTTVSAPEPRPSVSATK